MPEAILVLNAGSSSIKFSVYALGEDDRLSQDSKGQVEGIGTKPHFVARDVAGAALRDEAIETDGSDGHGQALRRLGDG
jgi:acetate kinase